MLVNHKQAFAYSLKELPGYNGPPISIQMVDPDKPIQARQRQYSKLESDIRDSKCQELQEVGFISEIPTTNPWSSNPTMPAKKDADGNWTDHRFCINYIRVNDGTVTDNYSPPLPEDLFQAVQGCKVFSKLDERSGFHQLPLDEASKNVTAFWWGRRLFRYERLPFGLKNSTAYFQRVMDQVLREAGLDHCARAFVDDVLIFSQDKETHLQHVQQVLEALYKVGLRVHPGKCVFATDRVEYLGHMVTPDGLEPLAAKVEAMAALPVPTSVEQLRSYMGLLNYYRCYVPDFSAIAQPLNQLLQKGRDVQGEWGDQQDLAFAELKRVLCTPGLVLRRPDPSRQFILHTDWSKQGLGAVLGQLDDEGREYMVACASRSLNVHERNYTPWKGEMLAAVWGVKLFRVYLHGRHFELCTDHRPLLQLLQQEQATGQHARWQLCLQEYDYHIRHRPGVTHNNADVPSRYPVQSDEDATGARLDDASDPLRGPVPQVVFGPVGQGQLQDIPAGYQPEPEDDWVRQLEAGGVLVEHVAAVAALGRALCVAQTLQQRDAFCCLAAHVAASEDDMGLVDEAVAEAVPATAAREQQEALQRLSTRWVSAVLAQGAPPSEQQVTQQGAFVRAEVVGSTFFAAVWGGLVVYEPFGGICSGLEMVLRNGFPVAQYLYSDIDPVVQQIARHRVQCLQDRYPHLLPSSAVQHAFELLPMDVTSAQLLEQLPQLARCFKQQWLVVGGWECTDLSPAGNCGGLQGERSSTFLNLLHILRILQQECVLQPGYLVENTNFQDNRHSERISSGDFEKVCRQLLRPVRMDAAQFGSRAHRVRNWWTNLCSADQLERTVQVVLRQPGLLVSQVLQPGRREMQVRWDDRPPRFACNQAGQPMQAWPTFVAYPVSRAFRPGQPGAVWDEELQRWDEPSAVERERAMGYRDGDTEAPGVTEQQRRSALGRCMDANNLQAIMAIAAAWHRRQHWCKSQQQVAIDLAALGLGGDSVDDSADVELAGGVSALVAIQAGLQRAQWPLQQLAVACAAERVDKGGRDIWLDEATLHCLRSGQHLPGSDKDQVSRVCKRVKLYQLDTAGRVIRVLPDGRHREVPKPEEREALVARFHQQCGHFGVRRTLALVQTAYWWAGMGLAVAQVLSQCKFCDRVRSSFNAQVPELRPLPICGLFYRWGVDLCGPFPETPRGNKYVMVAIEHYSKWCELVCLPSKAAGVTAAAFAAEVLTRFGSCAEVLTDQGSEWKGEFAELLQSSLIDHRETSSHRPQADGLAERMVQTLKAALQKLCGEEGTQFNWDLQVPYVGLGYRCSPAAGTRLVPYKVLFARDPTIPPAIVQRMEQPLDFDDPVAAQADVLARAELVKQYAVMAGENLRIAQHRDKLRYARLRDGSYLPRIRRFEVGDFVYCKRHQRHTMLDIKAKPLVLRVHEVRPSGVLVLQGRCGGLVPVHVEHCAPCHLTNINPNLDLSLVRPEEDLACEVCNDPGDAEHMLLCDGCGLGTHLQCCDPALTAVPKGAWVCGECQRQGMTAARAGELAAVRRQLEQKQQAPEEFTPVQQQARGLHGRLVIKVFVDPVTKRPRPYWGRLAFRGRSRSGG